MDKLRLKWERAVKNLNRAKANGDFRRIHKWENALVVIGHRRCPWNRRGKGDRVSLFTLRKRLKNLNLSDYKWDWCGTCQCSFVRCPHCGNNSCNGLYGRFRPDGSKPIWEDKWDDLVWCKVCSSAYDVQHYACRLGKEPKRTDFPDASEKEEKADCWMRDVFGSVDDAEEKS